MTNLSPEEIVILGTAIAFELAKNQSPSNIATLCALMQQILFTLSNLKKN